MASGNSPPCSRVSNRRPVPSRWGSCGRRSGDSSSNSWTSFLVRFQWWEFLGLCLIESIGDAAFWWWRAHYLQEPTPLRARRQLFQIHAADAGLVVEDGVVGVFPSERFPPLDPILRVLLAEEKRHARLPGFLDQANPAGDGQTSACWP